VTTYPHLRFPLLTCGIALSFTVLLLFLLAAASYWTCDREAASIRQNIELEQTHGALLYYNEAATMAIRMALAEKDFAWEEKYRHFNEKLDNTVRQWIKNAPNQSVLQTAIEVDNINTSLELLDRKSFDLFRAGKPADAKAILLGAEYQTAQAHYEQSLNKLANEIRNAIKIGEREQRNATITSVASVAAVIILIVSVWSVLVRYLNKWSRTLICEYENRVRAERSLTDAQRQLQKYTGELEKLVAQRTADLEKTAKRAEAFSYSLVHDLRAPVHTMQGFASALIEDYGTVFDRTGRQYADGIVESGKRLENLINDLLQYTQVTKQTIQLETIDLQSAVNQCLIALRSEIQARKAEVRVSEGWTPVLGNRSLIQVAFSNLITNALKYVAPGVTPKIEIWAEDAGKYLKVFVKDNGIGIAPSHHGKIFEMFQRLHRQEEYAGTGLGLTIVQQAVERMNGRVNIHFSEPGQGSSFVIQLQKAIQNETG
jgi:signal transduction histidine kinase